MNRCTLNISVLILTVLWSSSAIAQGKKVRDVDGRLVVTSADVLLDPAFSIRAVLNRIADPNAPLDSTFDDAKATDQAAVLLATMVDTLDDPTFRLRESDIEVPQPVRPEAKLRAQDLVKKGGPLELVPLALFNRMDLMPVSTVHCGEHRIVYGIKRKNASTSFPRFFIIFEPAIGSPDSNDALACIPLAMEWEKVGRAANDANKLAILKKIYFEGLTSASRTYEPAIRAKHFGEPFGQVRSNMFFVDGLSGPPWQLREWRVENLSGMKFVAHPVKDSAHGAFWHDVVPGNSLGNEQRQFHADLVTASGFGVFLPELKPGPSSCSSDVPGFALLNNFIADIPKRYLGGKSDAAFPGSAFPEDSALTAGPEVRGVIEALADVVHQSQPNAPKLHADQVLSRFDAMSCGGCHATSNGRAVAHNVVWPSSNGFVHVTEERVLSPALHNVFLPFRACAFDQLLALPQEPSTRAFLLSRAPGVHLHRSGRTSDTVNAYQDVLAARTKRDERRLFLRSIDSPTPADDETLRTLIERARVLEQAEPGVVVPRRRTHG